MTILFIFIILFFGIGSFYFAPWVPTKTVDIERIYNLINPKKTDIFYELGCGDGRLSFYFAKKGIKSKGFEISLFFFLYCNIKKLFLKESNVEFVFGDFFNKNIKNATIVYFFGTDKTINNDIKFKKKLQEELVSGTKIVSYLFSINWLTLVDTKKDKDGMSIYIYKI